ncbi:MAG: 30S ribosomal protein S16 [Patescibacteria group bacterium]|nr:30S ribosomal protein S16 [Patescibacteria group bacterium]
MLVIRLTRVGKKKQPTYRVVVQDKLRDPWGRALEIVGTYNPRTKPKTIKFDEERIKFWLSRGASPSATVNNLLVDAKIAKGPKAKATVGHKKKEKK